MPLHPKIEAGLQHAARLPRIDELSPKEARGQLRELWLSVPKRRAPPLLASVEDRVIVTDDRGLPIRIYTPEGSGPFPIVNFIHGGGFVAGDLESYDDLCRRIAGLVPAVVVAPDYRLAPEARYPAAIDDCTAAIRWSRDHALELDGDPRRIAVAGDSAGGNLAVMSALRLRGDGLLRAQLLMYPVTDHYASGFSSYDAFAEGYGLTARGMRWFWDHYLGSEDPIAHERASPLRAERLTGLPETMIVSAEYDVLRDEAEAFAARLSAEGVAVRQERASGMNHAFLMLAGALPEAQAELEEACAWLRRTLGAATSDSLVWGDEAIYE